MEANDYGCLTEALTVAAMLSSETALLPGQRLVFTFSIRLKKLPPFIKKRVVTISFMLSYSHTLLITSSQAC